MTVATMIRLRIDPTNPGQILACCGLFELADRMWDGAEGWFEDRARAFCLRPLEISATRSYTAKVLLETFVNAKLTNTAISEAQLRRREEIVREERKVKRDVRRKSEYAELLREKAALDELWEYAKNEALHIGPPFNLRLDWYLDDLTGASRFKTWAGKQTITQIARELKEAVARAAFEDSETEWLFKEIPCDKSLNFDARGGASDLDVGFSFDPLKISSPTKRALLQILAFIGLQRFSPRRSITDGVYEYTAWQVPLLPEVAQAASRGAFAGRAPVFTFRLHSTKYLKSFLPAQPQGERYA